MALEWVLFNLTGTLVDPTVLAQPLGDTGGDEDLVLSALDDAVAMAMVDALTGGRTPLDELMGAAMRRTAAARGPRGRPRGRRARADGTMPAYLEAPGALEALRGAGCGSACSSQSSAAAADAVLRFAGLRDRFELVLSAQDAGAYKPDLRPYRMRSSHRRRRGDEVASSHALVGRGRRQARRAADRLGRPARALAARQRPAARLSAGAISPRSRGDRPRSR